MDRSSGEATKAWPVKYSTMFHMTNDSDKFRTRSELEEKEGAWPIGHNRFGSLVGEQVPLYEGKMVQAFDHRAASIVINPKNLHRPAQPRPTTPEQHRDPSWLPDPQYWVLRSETSYATAPYLLGFKDVTAPTNVRSMIAALIPGSGVGNTLPIVTADCRSGADAALLAANFNAVVFVYVARQKIQGQHLNWFIVEQLPVVPPERYKTLSFGAKTAEEIVCEAVLELTYTAHDMAPFAREMGHVDEQGETLPSFPWDANHRLHLRAKLDALYFHLYGVTDRDDICYVYSTFPIVEREETAAYGTYRSRDLDPRMGERARGWQSRRRDGAMSGRLGSVSCNPFNTPARSSVGFWNSSVLGSQPDLSAVAWECHALQVVRRTQAANRTPGPNRRAV